MSHGSGEAVREACARVCDRIVAERRERFGTDDAHYSAKQAAAEIRNLSLPTLPAASGWVPIESALKDGTWVLLAGGDVDDDSGESRMAVAQWTNDLNGRKTEWHWQHCWYDGGYYGWYKNPTHWQPLPAPPAESKGER